MRSWTAVIYIISRRTDSIKLQGKLVGNDAVLAALACDGSRLLLVLSFQNLHGGQGEGIVMSQCDTCELSKVNVTSCMYECENIRDAAIA